MKCSRCGMILFHEIQGPGEHIASCNMCGYYSARVIDCFVGETPIYKNILHEPLGVVISEKGNYQYFSESQLHSLRIKHNGSGFTYLNKNKKWVVQDLKASTSKIFKKEDVGQY